MHGAFTPHADMASTTIRIDTETRNELQARGRMGESYDDVIRRLLAATRPKEGTPVELGRRMPAARSNPLFVHEDRA